MKDVIDYRLTGFAVCFDGRVHHWWQGWLKKGFCHCFLLVEQTHGVCLVDALAPNFKVVILPPPITLQMAMAHYERLGCRIIYRRCGISLTPALNPSTPQPYRPRRSGLCWGEVYSCVSLIKSFLQLQRPCFTPWFVPWIITPWQLYNFLQKNFDQELAEN
ncbi:MAG: hypothetical protein QM529_02370 [Hydrotalea sp.]|nr:hypothetical protein [Hydrotalea sp.]